MKISKPNETYLVYLVKYLGVALISGSVVHIGTLQNGFTRYLLLGFVGVALMIIGNIIEAKQNGQKINLNYLLIITGLSFATGFLSGGVQHYMDNPTYAGYLLSIGLFVSYITFFLKDKLKISKNDIVLVFIISIAIFFLSNYVVSDYISDSHQEHGIENIPEHGH